MAKEKRNTGITMELGKEGKNIAKRIQSERERERALSQLTALNNTNNNLLMSLIA